MDNKHLLPSVIQLAKQAGEEILTIYRHVDEVIVSKKDNASPVTEADLVAHHLIAQGLQQLTPEWPILSEEAIVPYERRQHWQRYWLVDPLDGTREFLEKNGEFTVNIALIVDHQPVLGVIYAPAFDCCYFASMNEGAYKQEKNQKISQKIHTQTWQGGTARVVASRRSAKERLQNFLAQVKDYILLQQGSSLKCCLVAEGKADIYPRLGPTAEWDTAAAQCILTEAGGAMFDDKGNPLRYNTKEPLENPIFLAVGDVKYNWLKFLS